MKVNGEREKENRKKSSGLDLRKGEGKSSTQSKWREKSDLSLPEDMETALP